MEIWVPIGKKSDFRGQVMRTSYQGVPIAIFQTAQGLFALKDECSHERAPVSFGEVEDLTVTCPRHGAKFDLKSGKPLSLPAVRPIQTFQVKLEDDTIYLKWESQADAE